MCSSEMQHSERDADFVCVCDHLHGIKKKSDIVSLEKNGIYISILAIKIMV